MEKDKSML